MKEITILLNNFPSNVVIIWSYKDKTFPVLRHRAMETYGRVRVMLF